MKYNTPDGSRPDELGDYKIDAWEKGTLDLLKEAEAWAEFMEQMLSNYQGPVTLDADELSAEGINFLIKFWFYGKLLHPKLNEIG